MSRTRARDSSRAVWTSWLDLSAPVLLDSQVETSARVPISLQIDRYSDVLHHMTVTYHIAFIC